MSSEGCTSHEHSGTEDRAAMGNIRQIEDGQTNRGESGRSGEIESLRVGTRGVVESLGVENGGVRSIRFDPGGQGNGGVEYPGPESEGGDP